MIRFFAIGRHGASAGAAANAFLNNAKASGVTFPAASVKTSAVCTASVASN